jgi:diketogulonate reductase-like aldo/keto reductase
MTDVSTPSRRTFIKRLALLAATTTAGATSWAQPKAQILSRRISSTGQQLPLIGMGSYITFNVGNDPQARLQRCEVLKTFFELGGELVDSSPMYGSSEAVLGFCIKRLGQTASKLFSATKVWTPSSSHGRQQIADSERLWGVPALNLNQVHNMLNWRDHLETLLQMKADGRLQYVGVTTSHGSGHDEMEKIMLSQPIDFIQLSYHLNNRSAEARLLPLALEKGIAVIVNRPFSRGALFRQYQRYELPEWASEIDCDNWAQFFLKFVVSHPAVTCAIPATSQVDHMRQNMGACYGRLPDAAMRQHMLNHVKSI